MALQLERTEGLVVVGQSSRGYRSVSLMFCRFMLYPNEHNDNRDPPDKGLVINACLPTISPAIYFSYFIQFTAPFPSFLT